MLFILCQTGTEGQAQVIAQDVRAGCELAEEPRLIQGGGSRGWVDKPAWDDVLLVVYRSRDMEPLAGEMIQSFRDAHPILDSDGALRPGGFVIPVALDSAVPRPPDIIGPLKALVWDDNAKGPNGALVQRVRVLLGLSLRRSEYQVFISYSSRDGKEVAAELYKQLAECGFHPWLDEAQDNLPSGSDVQDEIHKQLTHAGLVLLVDTPMAPASRYINEEVDIAIAALLPILPIVVGRDDVSRFVALQGLRRRIHVDRDRHNMQALSQEEWATVADGIERLLTEIYRRRIRVPQETARTFRRYHYSWSPIDEPKNLFKAERDRSGGMGTLGVLSHCSLHDPKNIPVLKAVWNSIRQYNEIARYTHKLYVYDHPEILSEQEIDHIQQLIGEPLPLILTHYNELSPLIESNFMERGHA